MGSTDTKSLTTIKFSTTGTAGTSRAAELLAPFLKPGDTLLLDGELAAGKTHFVKALVSAFGSDELVTSPTYALVHLYKTPKALVIHVDAYRLNSVAEFHDLGLADYSDDAITVIEWGQKIRSQYASPLQIDIAPVAGDPDKRVISISSSSPRWKEVLASLSEQAS